MTASLLRRLLAHPVTAGRDLDDPRTSELRRQIISSKPSLRAIYDEWYSLLAQALPPGDGQVLELGSGGGYCAQFIPGLIPSDVFACSGTRIVADALSMPFANQSLRAIVMTNVLHHMPDVRQFFAEASRVLRPGGKILMIEPWTTPWSSFVYRYLHHESFRPEAVDWSYPSTGPLSGANIAIPWIVFARDRGKFASAFPEFFIEQISAFLPFRYLLSGGVGLRSLVPEWTRMAWARLERMLASRMSRMGMFAFISVRRL